jgi:spermidine synthase
MGATLPLVARVAASRVALLYGANTAGGALGSLLGAYVIIPALGLAASLRAGACVSIAIGVAAIALSRGEDAAGDPALAERTPQVPAAQRLPATLLVAAAASGFMVFAGEVVFVHLLALVDGTSVYVFGLVLAVFLVALAAGASLSRLLERHMGDGALSTSLALSGLALAATLPVWDHLPSVFVWLGPSVSTWAGREAIRAAVAAMAIGIPATCMGTTFPLVLSSLASRADRGAQTGRVTAVNTMASVVGSVVGGYALLPALGSQRACAAIALSYAVAALVVGAPRRRAVVLVAAATAGALLVAPRWDLARLASGANVYFAPQPEQGRVVWVHEDVHGGVVTVTEAAARHTLWTNGKYQGDDGPQMQAQRGFADVPAMFVSRYGRALVVGLGTGTTLAALSEYPFARIDVAELSPGISQAARSFFATANRGVLDDPRVRLVQEDGRNLLLVGEDRFDLVTIELTSIWFAGAANLYNREFYATAARRLQEGGVLSQWIQLHHTTLIDIASQMATARAVFPHGAFFVRGEQGMLVSSLAPLVAHPRMPSDLDDLVLADDTIDAFVDDVCAEAHVARTALVSTDDSERLEYATPRNNVPGAPPIAEMHAQLLRWRRDELAARVGIR